jgi:hypothetical protein
MMLSMPRVAIPPLRFGQSGASWLAPSSLPNRSKSLAFLAKQVRGCRDAMPHKAASHALILPPQPKVASLTLGMPRSWPRLRTPSASAKVALPSPGSRASPRLPLDCRGERVVGGCVRGPLLDVSVSSAVAIVPMSGARQDWKKKLPRKAAPGPPATAPLAVVVAGARASCRELGPV